MAANVFEPAAQESTARKALGVALANADADTVARLATTCRVLRDDSRCAPQLVFGPASKIWTATATGSAPNRPDPAVAGPADDILTAVVTRHRPGRLQRLVLCPPSDPRPTAPWARVAAAAASSRGALLPGTVQFCCEVQSALRCVWAEPGALRPNRDGHTAAAQGVVPVDKDDALVLVTRGACSAIPRAAHRVGLFTRNLARLAVGAAANMEDDAVRTVLRQCANLRAFEITDGGEHLTGLGWGSKDDPEAPAEANALIALRLARCPSLTTARIAGPKLSTLALTDCVALTRIDVRARGDGGNVDDSLPEMRTVTVGSFRATVPGEEDADAAAEMIVDVDEIVALARRCPNLEALCAPASASSAAVDDDEGVVDEWSDALRGAAGTLREVCFQRPLTTTGLLLLVAGAAADTDGAMPALESIWAAARLVLPTKRHTTSDDARDDDGTDGEDAAPPTEADAVAEDAAAIVAMCPSLRRLTFAHPGERKPPAANGDGASRERWDATEAFETARAARELTRGALLGRCRVAAEEGASRAVDIDVVVDFAGGDVASAFGAADAPTEGGLETILRECDAVAPLAEF